MKKILVTGGAGFLGSYLCEKLLKIGNEVICLDNYLTGNKTNISHLQDFYEFEILRHDITNPLDVEVDEIYNLACPASPEKYQLDPVKTINTNVNGSINMLELAKNINAKIFQASTSEIYGDPLEHPQSENYWGHVNPIGIRSCYDEGKRCAETLFFDYHRQYMVNIKIARIFNTYGPRMAVDDGRVVSNFISQALKNENITIYGEGTQTRSFCYVSDLIDGIIKLMNKEKSFNGPINLGNPNETKISDLAKMIIDITGSKSNITFKKLPQDDPKKRMPDITLAKEHLKWEPKIDLKTGIVKTISYIESKL